MPHLLRTSVFYFLFLVSIPVCAQPMLKKKGETLKIELKTKLNDTVRIQKLQLLSLYYINKVGGDKEDIDSSYTCAREAELLSDKIHYQRGKLISPVIYSQIYREGGDSIQAKKELNKAFYNSKKYKLYWLEGEAYRELSNYYPLNNSSFPNRMLCVDKSLQAFRKSKSKKDIADVLVYYAGHYTILGKYKEALQKFEEAKTIYKSIKFTELQNLYSQIFRVYLKIGLYEEAVKSALISIKLAEFNKDNYYLLNDYKNLGTTYYYMDNYALALKYHKKAFEYSLTTERVFYTIFISKCIIKDMLKLGQKKEAKLFLDNVVEKQKIYNYIDLLWFKTCHILVYDALGWYDLANKYSNELVEEQNKNKALLYDLSLIETNDVLINHFFKIKKYELASQYLQTNKKLCLSVNDINMISSNQLMEFKLDSASGNYLNAIANLKKYQKIKDSLFNEVKSFQISNLEIQYQTGNKDKNIQLLTKQSALQKAKIKSDQTAKLIVGLVLFLVLIITGLIFRGYQNKKESNKKLEASKKRIEQKNKILQNVVQEKEWLLKEIHHRVKNNLQVVMSLLNTQSSYLQDESAVMAIKDSQNRINSMSLIHQRLYQSEGLSCIRMPEYIKELINHLKDSYQTNSVFKINIEDIEMHVSQAIPVGLILNEAITNSLKYAFPDGRKGTISIRLNHFQDDYFVLEIADNGIGIEGEIDLSKYNSLGMKLMEGLTRDLNGKFEVLNEDGLKVTVTFIYDYSFNIKIAP